MKEGYMKRLWICLKIFILVFLSFQKPVMTFAESPLTRRRFGNWEGDSLVSRKSLAALNSLVERKSRLLFLLHFDLECGI